MSIKSSYPLLLAWSRAALILTAAVAYQLGFAPLYGAWGAGVALLPPYRWLRRDPSWGCAAG